MERELKAYLLKVARTFERETGYAMTTISRKTTGNHFFFGDFAKGKRTITLSKYQKVLREFKKRWPDGVPFPAPPQLPTLSSHKKPESANDAGPDGHGDANEDNDTRGTGRGADDVNCLSRQA